MKLLNNLIVPAFCGLLIFSGCSDNPEDPGTQPPSTNPEPPAYLGGYADPDGVLILNQGAAIENSSLTYITPEGNIEQNVYQKVNGSAFGHGGQDLYMHNGKLYILSTNKDVYQKHEGDGTLVIADAVTLKREKVFKFDELKYPRPEGSLDENEFLPLVTPLRNIVVIDEKNIFFSDQKALFRFDSTTGQLNIVEDSYHFGNQGNTIEAVAGTKGMVVIGDYIYTGGGGFWASTRLLEFKKGENKATRILPDLKGEFISGVCQTGEREIMIATCGRSGSTKSYFIFVNLDTWEIVKEKQVSADISAEFFDTPGIALAGDYVYFCAGKTSVSRISLKTWKVEENIIDLTKDAPNAKYLNCNAIADPIKKYLYVAVSDEYYETTISNGNLLVYDCSGETPVLVKNIENKTSYPVGIYPMSKFYK